MNKYRCILLWFQVSVFVSTSGQTSLKSAWGLNAIWKIVEGVKGGEAKKTQEKHKMIFNTYKKKEFALHSPLVLCGTAGRNISTKRKEESSNSASAMKMK